MKKAVLRYGMFAILIVMVVGVFYMLDVLSLRQKVTLQVFVTDTSSAKAYTTLQATSFKKNATLHVVQTAGGEMDFNVDTMYFESGNVVLLLTSTDSNTSVQERLQGNSYTQGYVFIGTKSLLRLVVEKLR